MKNYFRKPITREIAIKAIQALGLTSFTDCRWVGEKEADVEKQSAFMAEMYDYYYPVHSKTYLEKKDFKYKDFLTIVKQVLRTQDFELERKEACDRVSARTYIYFSKYRIKNPTQPTEDFVLSFT